MYLGNLGSFKSGILFKKIIKNCSTFTKINGKVEQFYFLNLINNKAFSSLESSYCLSERFKYT
jgi:hypothetical protein